MLGSPPGFRRHDLRRHQLFAGQMSAALGQLLVFDVNAGHSRALQEPDRAFDMQRFSKAGIRVTQ